MWARGSVRRELHSPVSRSHLKRLFGKHVAHTHRPPGIYYQHLLHKAFSRSVSAEKSCSADLFINLMFLSLLHLCILLSPSPTYIQHTFWSLWLCHKSLLNNSHDSKHTLTWFPSSYGVHHRVIASIPILRKNQPANGQETQEGVSTWGPLVSLGHLQVSAACRTVCPYQLYSPGTVFIKLVSSVKGIVSLWWHISIYLSEILIL